MSTGTLREPDEVLLGFTTALRAAGVAVTHDRSAAFLEACAHVGLADAAAVRTAGRSTLCGGPDDLHRFDRVFEAYFDHRAGLPRPRPATPGAPTLTSLPETDAEGAAEGDDSDPVRARASDADVLRHRDVATLSAGEKQRLAAQLARLRFDRLGKTRREGVPPGTTAGTAGRSTPAPRSAPRCAASASPPPSPTAVAAPARAGWCCWSTCPAR